MRYLIALPLAAALAACSVSGDDQNDSMTIQYNEDVAAEAASDVGNAAETAANEVATGAAEVANDVKNVDVDADVDVRTDGGTANAN